jgi:sugar diacid utilization regulator
MAKDRPDAVSDTGLMLADRLLVTEPFERGEESAVSAAWRDLHGAMIASLQGGGLEDVAKLAHEASGVPITILVPGVVAVIEPVSATTAGECAMLARRVREIVNRPGPPEFDGFSTAVPIRHNGRTVGLVAPWQDSVDSELSQLANPGARANTAPFTRLVLEVTAAAVLTSLVIEDARMETEHRLRGSFLEQLRAGDALSGAEIARRSARLGCDVSGGAVLLCVEVEGTRPRLVALGVTDEHPGAFAHAIEPVDGGSTQVWVILPALPDSGEGVVEATLGAAKRLAARLRQHGPVGLSRFHADPTEFGRGLDEAELMLDVMRKAAVPPGSEIVEGTYKLLFRLLASHPDELSSYHATTIAPLVAHDDQYRTDLVRTLEVYLDTNCNMNVTADTIFAHRHTVAHRLERINELTGLDPTIHEDREQLGLGL